MTSKTLNAPWVNLIPYNGFLEILSILKNNVMKQLRLPRISKRNLKGEQNQKKKKNKLKTKVKMMKLKVEEYSLKENSPFVS